MNKTLTRRVGSQIVGAVLAGLFALPAICLAAVDETLDQPIKNFSATKGQEVISLCIRLAVPCGVEEFAEDALDGTESQQQTRTARQILDDLSKAHPSYSWQFGNGMIQVRYVPTKEKKVESPLDRKIKQITIKDRLSMRAVQDVLKEAGIKAGFGLSGDPHFAIVSLDLKDITVREALNQIVKADGKVAWYFQFSSKGGRNNYNVVSWHVDDGVPLFESPQHKRRKKE